MEDVEDTAGVGMRHAAGELDLVPEPRVGTLVVRDLRPDRLEGHVVAQLEVGGGIDLAHPALGQEPLDAEAAGQHFTRAEGGRRSGGARARAPGGGIARSRRHARDGSRRVAGLIRIGLVLWGHAARPAYAAAAGNVNASAESLPARAAGQRHPLQELDLPRVVDVVQRGAEDETPEAVACPRSQRFQAARPQGRDHRAQLAVLLLEQGQVGPPGALEVAAAGRRAGEPVAPLERERSALLPGEPAARSCT
jgi:hypothetical protein